MTTSAAFTTFLERVQHLRVDRSSGTPRPYKPLLLAAVAVLIHKGELRSPDVFLDGGLRSVFHQLLRRLYPGQFESAKPEYPFRHLATDRIWKLVARRGSEALLQQQLMGGEAWQVLRHVTCARLDDEVFAALAASFENRFALLHTLARTYAFPVERTGYLWELLGPANTPLPVSLAAEPTHFTERALEEHLEQHWKETEFFRRGVRLCVPERDELPCRQVLTPINTIDLLGFEEARRRWWVFELKKGRSSDAVVGQTGRYMTWVSDFVREKQPVVGAIIVGRVDEKLKASVRSNERLSLWRYDERLALHEVPLRAA